jgi:hypothetical protein
VRPAAAAPPRRPEQVEQVGRHRAAQIAPPSLSRVREGREYGQRGQSTRLSIRACRRRRPGSSTAAASSFAPIARAPSAPRTGISLKWDPRRRQQPQRRPGGPSRSVGIAPPSLVRARDHSEHGQRCRPHQDVASPPSAKLTPWLGRAGHHPITPKRNRRRREPSSPGCCKPAPSASLKHRLDKEATHPISGLLLRGENKSETRPR